MYPNLNFNQNDPNRYEVVEVDMLDKVLPQDTKANFVLIDT